MDFFQKNFTFNLKSNDHFEDQLNHYFEFYNFKKTKVDEHHFIF